MSRPLNFNPAPNTYNIYRGSICERKDSKAYDSLRTTSENYRSIRSLKA